MLVLISFVLVLVATGLLVIGLLQDGLTLIYISIACSIAAGVILGVAVKVARPKTAGAASTGAAAQEPDLAGATGSTAASSTPPPPTQTSAPISAEPVTAVVPAVAAAPAPVVEQAPEPMLADDTFEDDAFEDDAFEDDADFFPIADYDDLRVGEIVPLLPELYADELDVVEARERAGKNRTSIITRLQALRAGAATYDEPADLDGGEATSEVIEEEWAAADDEWEAADTDDFFIGDYDDLRVGEVRDLLPTLSDDELYQVRAREVAGSSRKMVLEAIDRQLEEAAPAAQRGRRAGKAAPAKKVAAAKRATTGTGRSAVSTKKAATKKATTTKTPTKKAATTRSPAKRTPTKRTPTKR